MISLYLEAVVAGEEEAATSNTLAALGEIFLGVMRSGRLRCRKTEEEDPLVRWWRSGERLVSIGSTSKMSLGTPWWARLSKLVVESKLLRLRLFRLKKGKA